METKTTNWNCPECGAVRSSKRCPKCEPTADEMLDWLDNAIGGCDSNLTASLDGGEMSFKVRDQVLRSRFIWSTNENERGPDTLRAAIRDAIKKGCQ